MCNQMVTSEIIRILTKRGWQIMRTTVIFYWFIISKTENIPFSLKQK